MRRTKAAQIYKKTGNLRAVQLLLGHTKLESTVRYLGIEVDDALSISEQAELCVEVKEDRGPARKAAPRSSGSEDSLCAPTPATAEETRRPPSRTTTAS